MRKKAKTVEKLSEEQKAEIQEAGFNVVGIGAGYKIFYLPEDEKKATEILSGSKVEAYVESGDKGCGLPGTPEYSRAVISQSKTKKPIITLINDLYGKKLSDRMKLEDLKIKALEMIKD